MTDALVSAAICVVLIGGTVLIHYEMLRFISAVTSHTTLAHRRRMMAVVGLLMVAHMIEISIYAAAYFAMHHHFGLGTLAGETNGAFVDFLYFSFTCYTTLGVGDVFPRGAMRLVSGVEAFNGLVLIGWSASYTYFAMRKLWDS